MINVEMQLWVDVHKEKTVYGWTEDKKTSFTFEVDTEELFNDLIDNHNFRIIKVFKNGKIAGIANTKKDPIAISLPNNFTE